MKPSVFLTGLRHSETAVLTVADTGCDPTTINKFQEVSRSLKTRLLPYENAGFLFHDVSCDALKSQRFCSNFYSNFDFPVFFMKELLHEERAH